MSGTDGGGPAPSRRRVLAAAGAAGLSLFAGCLGEEGSEESAGGGTTPTAGPTETPTTESPEPTPTATAPAVNWRSVELEAAIGDGPFAVEDLPAPVVVQTFAAWCPDCHQQSEILAELDGAVTRVGLNTDPNEDAPKVRRYAADGGFGWRFAVAPPAMTESLIGEFGPEVANVPSTPVIVVCGDGSAELLPTGINTAGEVEAAAGDC